MIAAYHQRVSAILVRLIFAAHETCYFDYSSVELTISSETRPGFRTKNIMQNTFLRSIKNLTRHQLSCVIKENLLSKTEVNIFEYLESFMPSSICGRVNVCVCVRRMYLREKERKMEKIPIYSLSEMTIM